MLNTLSSSDLANIKLMCCDDSDVTMNFSDVKLMIAKLKSLDGSATKLFATSSSYMPIGDITEFKVLRHSILGVHISHVHLTTESWIQKVNSNKALANRIDGQIVVFCSVYITFLKQTKFFANIIKF